MNSGRQGKTQVGLLTVIQEELDAVLQALEADSRYPRSQYWHGSRGSESFVVAKMADRTNVVASEATRDMIEHWRPDVILLVGIAGALESGAAELGDVVIPDYLHYGDFRKLTDASDHLRFAAYDHPTVSLRSQVLEGVGQGGLWHSRLTEQRPDPAPSEVFPKVVVGALVAGEKVMGDPDHPEQERLFTTFENATAVDMESWGVGRTVHSARTEPGYNPRLGVIRGISDIVHRAGSPRDPDTVGTEGAASGRIAVAGVNNAQRSRWKKYAAASAAAFAAEVVQELTNDA